MRSGCPGLGSVYLHMGPLTCSPLPGLSKLQEVREVQTLPTCSIVAHSSPAGCGVSPCASCLAWRLPRFHRGLWALAVPPALLRASLAGSLAPPLVLPELEAPPLVLLEPEALLLVPQTSQVLRLQLDEYCYWMQSCLAPQSQNWVRCEAKALLTWA